MRSNRNVHTNVVVYTNGTERTGVGTWIGLANANWMACSATARTFCRWTAAISVPTSGMVVARNAFGDRPMPDPTIKQVYEKYDQFIGNLLNNPEWMVSQLGLHFGTIVAEIWLAIRAHVETRCVWTVVADQWSTYDAGRFNTGCGKQAWWQFSHMEQFKCCPYCGQAIERKEVENANAE